MARSEPNKDTKHLEIIEASAGTPLSASEQLNPVFEAVQRLIENGVPVRADGEQSTRFTEAKEMAGWKWPIEKPNSIERATRRQMWDRRMTEQEYKFASDNPEIVSRITTSPHEVALPTERFHTEMDQQQLAHRPINLPKVRFAVTYDDGSSYPAQGSGANIWPIRFKNIKRDLPRGNGINSEPDFFEFPRDDGPDAVDDWAFAFTDEYIEPDTLVQVSLINETWIMSPLAVGVEIVTLMLMEDIPPRDGTCYGIGQGVILNKTVTRNDEEEVTQYCEPIPPDPPPDPPPPDPPTVTVSNPRCSTFYERSVVQAYLVDGVYEIMDHPCSHYIGISVGTCPAGAGSCLFRIATSGGDRQVLAVNTFGGVIPPGRPFLLELTCECLCEPCDNCMWIACCPMPWCEACAEDMPVLIEVEITAACYTTPGPIFPADPPCDPLINAGCRPNVTAFDNSTMPPTIQLVGQIDICEQIRGHRFELPIQRVSGIIGGCCWSLSIITAEYFMMRQLFEAAGGDWAACQFLGPQVPCDSQCGGMAIEVCVGQIPLSFPPRYGIYATVTSNQFNLANLLGGTGTSGDASWFIRYELEIPLVATGEFRCRGAYTLHPVDWGLANPSSGGTTDACFPQPVGSSRLRVRLSDDDC